MWSPVLDPARRPPAACGQSDPGTGSSFAGAVMDFALKSQYVWRLATGLAGRQTSVISMLTPEAEGGCSALRPAPSPHLNDALTTPTKQRAGTSPVAKPSLRAPAQPSSHVPGERGAGSTWPERKPVHPTTSRASGAEKRGGCGRKPLWGLAAGRAAFIYITGGYSCLSCS